MGGGARPPGLREPLLRRRTADAAGALVPVPAGPLPASGGGGDHRRRFGCDVRDGRITGRIHELRALLKRSVHDFLARSGIDLLVVENVLAIPLNVPLALAVTEAIAETGIPTIAHHHDFHWERKRFVRNCIGDFLRCACPPTLPSIQHVVINSAGRHQLALRTGATATLIPNVMDFAAEAPPVDAYAADVRDALGLGDEEL